MHFLWNKHTRHTTNILHLRMQGLWGAYSYIFFLKLGSNLIGLFLPIYIYKITEQIWTIPLFWLIWASISFLSQIPASKLINKLGMDKSMALGAILRIIYFSLLLAAEYKPNMLWWSLLAGGAMIPFSWLPYHYMIAVLSREKKFGRASSVSTLTNHLSTIIGPLVGGIIISGLGFSWLYMIAIIFLSIAVIMPFKDNFDKYNLKISTKRVFHHLTSNGIYKHGFAYSLRALSILVFGLLWPIWIFNLFNNYESTGIFQSLSFALMAIAIYTAGKLSDKHNFRIIKLGSLLQTLSWWLRGIIIWKPGLLLIDLINNTSTHLIWVPFDALVYERSTHHFTFEFWVVRELLWFGSIIFGSLLILLLIITQIPIPTIFIITGFISLLGWIIPKLFQTYIKRYPFT